MSSKYSIIPSVHLLDVVALTAANTVMKLPSAGWEMVPKAAKPSCITRV